MNHRIIQRGDIFYVDLYNREGSEQSGMRPVIVIQNDTGNFYSQTVIVACITSRIKKLYMPTHVLIYPGRSGLSVRSMTLLEQLITIDKNRLLYYIGTLDSSTMNKVDRALAISIGIRC